MYWPHCLQAVEMAARGSDCWWPQRGQVTRTLACFFAGIQSSAAPAAGGGSASDHFRRLGNFGRLACPWRRSGGRNLVRIDLGLANESHAFLDGEPGRANV